MLCQKQRKEKEKDISSLDNIICVVIVICLLKHDRKQIYTDFYVKILTIICVNIFFTFVLYFD